MEGNFLMVVGGVVMSLVFAYVPGLHEWYAELDGVRKGQVMLLALLVAAVIIYVGSCYLDYPWVTCGEAGWKQLIEMFIYGLMANQAAYLAAVRPRDTAAE